MLSKIVYIPVGPSSIRRNTLIYYFAEFCHSLIFTVPIWIAYYLNRISIVDVSFLVTFQYIVQMVLELPSGAVADMLGRRMTALIGFLVGALSFLLFPFATSLLHFTILAFMAGLLDSFRSGSEEALIYDSFKEAKKEEHVGKVYSDCNIIYQAGLIISSAIGGLLYEMNQYLPYILYGLSLLFGALLIYFYVEPKIDSEKFTLKNYLNQIKLGSKEAFKDNYTKYLSLLYIFVGGIAWSSTLYFNAYMLIDLGFNDSQRGILDSIMRLINIIIIALVLRNAKVFTWKRTILFFPIIMLIAYLPARLLNGYAGLPFVQAAMIATTARWTILAPLTNQVFSSKYRATAISFLSLMIGFVYISLTGLSGYVIAEYGMKTMYTLLGIASLLTVVPISAKLLLIKKPA